MLTDLEKDNLRRLKKHRALMAREAASKARKGWPEHFARLEAELLKLKPHLAEQRHCGLAPDSESHPRRRVVMPNGKVIYSTWYKVPTTEADSKLAYREAMWLRDEYPRLMQRREAAE
jgi:hypothetical protein